MNAIVPRPIDIDALAERWSTRGLVPLEVTERELIQTITIRHNPLTCKGEVKYERLDGVQAMGLIVASLRDLLQDTFKSELRPPLNSGHSKVCVELNGDELSVAFATSDPANPEKMTLVDPVIASGIALAAALLIAEKADAPGYDPLAVLLEGIQKRFAGEQLG